MNLNKVILAGNLTGKPELVITKSESYIANFSLATNRVWKNSQGGKETEATYHKIVVFGAMAKNCAEYLEKGQECIVEGRISNRSYEGNDGQKKFVSEIVAESLSYGNKASNGATYQKEPKKIKDEENEGSGWFPEDDGYEPTDSELQEEINITW